MSGAEEEQYIVLTYQKAVEMLESFYHDTVEWEMQNLRAHEVEGLIEEWVDENLEDYLA